jgi:PBSX family phage terminase large subunit
MALSEKAYRYLTTKPKFLNLLHGSISSGKTVSSLLALPERITKAPQGAILITGKTERSAYRNVIDPAIRMYGSRRVKYSKGMGEGRFGNRNFYVLGAHNERAEDNLRGITASYLYADEAVTYPQSVLDMALSRLRVEGALCDLTCNPGPPGHFINQSIILPTLEKKRDDVALWHFLLEDNPNLPQNYLEFLKNQYPLGSLFYKRNILGLWVLAEGAVYDFFDSELHRLKAEPKEEPDFVDFSCDYGTTNPLSVGVYHSWRNPIGNLRVKRHRAWYYDSRQQQRQLTDSEYADRLEEEFAEEKLQHRYFVVDPSAASFIQELKRRGWNVRAANNDVLDGIKHQAKMLKTGAYALGPHESNDQAEMDYQTYLWDKKAQDKGEDKPLKGPNDGSHTKDEERYDLYTLNRKESIGWVAQR